MHAAQTHRMRDLPRTYLAHHELESIITIIVLIIISQRQSIKHATMRTHYDLHRLPIRKLTLLRSRDCPRKLLLNPEGLAAPTSSAANFTLGPLAAAAEAPD